MAKLSKLLGLGREPMDEEPEEESLERSILQQDQQDNLEMDINILEDEDGSREQQA
ncbi:MAG: hypothetical protein HN380_03080, partial [Victivallales bacterium]|nr:hypothetical protein [Victivallales bacterium]